MFTVNRPWLWRALSLLPFALYMIAYVVATYNHVNVALSGSAAIFWMCVIFIGFPTAAAIGVVGATIFVSKEAMS